MKINKIRQNYKYQIYKVGAIFFMIAGGLMIWDNHLIENIVGIFLTLYGAVFYCVSEKEQIEKIKVRRER